MKKLKITIIALLAASSFAWAQSAPSENFCENVQYIIENFYSEDKMKGEITESGSGLLGDYEFYATKVQLDGFKQGEYANDMLMGTTCSYTYSQRVSRQELKNALGKLKNQVNACVSKDYKMIEGDDLITFSRIKNDEVDSYPALNISWKEVTGKGYDIELNFQEAIF